ncbi:MAG: hypothetical protein CME70_05320 [Halobacteriovorax sp.]|nr:hypothetical protein [Halobacteriovorax sp.]|tara:strand:+ start:70180 stop:71340 length:1161 start_codon:yes stop_codon:yes gene_type:complete
MIPGEDKSVLNNTAELFKAYDSLYLQDSRDEDSIKKEFHLFVQLHFMHGDEYPLDSSLKRVETFLNLAKGLRLFEFRKKAIMRFFELQNKDVPSLPENDELLLSSWKMISEIEYKRSRDLFKEANTQKIIELERNGLNYYKACHVAYPPNEEIGHDNIHLDSHREVAALLKAIIPYREDGKYRILEYGCGDGRLLWVLRQQFPNAELVATNIFGDWGVIGAVKKDTNTHITSLASVEDQTFNENEFDAVLSTEVIEHLVDPEEMIRGAKSVLKPGGAFIITAPSLHYEFLSNNPVTYAVSLVSVLFEGVLPRFHNMWQPLTDLPIVHYAFSYSGFKKIFRSYFRGANVKTTRFTHLKKFRLDKVASKIPILNRWGGLVVAYGNNNG